MEIHKPKPVHSWRELLTEIGVIVIGVAIALAAEQALEWLHWRHRVNDAVEAIKLELRDDDGPALFTRAAAAPCLDRQLDAIQQAVEAGRDRSEVAALTRQYAPPSFIWDRNAWDAMLASDVASHVPPDQIIKWGYVYSTMPRGNALAEQESDNLAVLDPVRRSAGKLSPGEADAILTAVARLRAVNRNFGWGAPGVLRYMEQSGTALPQEVRDRILGELRAAYPGCVPVPLPPPNSSNLGSPRRPAPAPQP